MSATGESQVKASKKPSAAAGAATKQRAAKQPAAKRSRSKKPATKQRFGDKFMDEMRRRLLAERAKYLHSAEEYRAEADSLLETREPGDVLFDEEGGEGATLAVEREHDIALSNQARETVAQIDAALGADQRRHLRLLHHLGCAHPPGPPPSDSLGRASESR